MKRFVNFSDISHMTQASPDPVFILRNSDKSPITCLKFLTFPSGTFLSAGTQNGDISLWDMNLKRVTQQEKKAHEVRGLLWIDQLKCSGHVVTTGRDGHLIFWDAGNGWQKINEVAKCSIGFCQGCVIPGDSTNSPLIAVPSQEESQVNIIDSVNQQNVAFLKPSDHFEGNKYGMCMDIAKMKHNQSGLLIGYENGCIALWDIRERKIIDCISLYEEMVTCVCCSESGHGWSGSVNDKLTQWSVCQDNGFTKLPAVQLTNSGINHMKLRNDERILAVAGWDSNIRILGTKKGKPLAVLSYHKLSVKCVAFSDNDLLAAGSQDGSISLWDIYR
ncbi:guanine nucleotide-binding protein subunit beta-like protein 1 isoform X1 [Octopus sinensis]|uniref:Guanine nucleotide-binding protein subunit beta-like protein 1 isoform X1 n=1 Tax=Octopus sinensis TaxID=2607531 RepID=A0A6P7TCA4_9MOLL|nr:guanine nucleotide-binding protein subunit beta-like protein 1 isoform X1 [Octopus sinensis]